MKRAAVAASLLLLAACASQPKNDFVAIGYEAADALVEEAKPELPGDAPIVYAVFTPVGRPETSSPFGQIFAEHVASRLVQKGIKVVEVRLREGIAVREGGPYALSDDAGDVAHRVRAHAALVGSYAVTSDYRNQGYVLVTARLIDVADGIVLASWDKRISLNSADYYLFNNIRRTAESGPAYFSSGFYLSPSIR